MAFSKYKELIELIDFTLLYTIFIVFIIIIKFSFITISAIIWYRKLAHLPSGDETGTKLSYWRGVTELIFIISMSLILIYSFFPRWKNPVALTNETKFLLFFYGIITIITADWDVFTP
jgi:hypothetical protein